MKTVQLLFLLVTLLFFTGCTEHSTKEQPLQLGLNEWNGYQPFFLAQHDLPPNTLKIIEVANNTEQMRLFRNGVLDLACLTLDEAVKLSQSVEDLEVIAVLDFSNGADAVIAHEKLPSLHALKGKRIGFEKCGVGAYMLHRLLEQASLAYADVTMVPLNSHEHEQAFADGRIDAVITFEPMVGNLKKMGGHAVFDSAMIPREVIDVLVVRGQRLREDREKIAMILDAWFETVDAINQDRSTALETLATQLNLETEAFKQSMERIAFPDRSMSKQILLDPKTKNLEVIMQGILTDIGQYAPTGRGTIINRKSIAELY